jgi:hypothetical protein
MGIASPIDTVAKETRPSSCRENVRKQLAPILARIQKIGIARKEHAELTAQRVAKTGKTLSALKAARKLFEARRAADLKYHDERIQAGELIISQIAAGVKNSIAKSYDDMRTARARGQDWRVRDLKKAVADLQAKHNKGWVTGFSRTVNYSTTTNGWHDFLKKEHSARKKRMSDHANGKVGIFVRVLNRIVTRPILEKSIADTERNLSATRAGKDYFFLRSIQQNVSIVEINKKLDELRDPLDKARKRIASGASAAEAGYLRRNIINNTAKKMIADVRIAMENLDTRAPGGTNEETRKKNLAEQLSGKLTAELCSRIPTGADLLDRQMNRLKKSSESKGEEVCRQAIYGDQVFVTKSGITHGSMRSGLLAALKDLGVHTRNTKTSAVQSAQPLKVEDTILMLKNLLDWSVGWNDATEFGLNRRKLDAAQAAIIQLQTQMRTISGSGKKLKQARYELAQKLLKSLEMVTDSNGFFFSTDYDIAIEGLVKQASRGVGKVGGRKVGVALRKLTRMKSAATSLNRYHLPRMANMVADFGRVADANLEAAWGIINTFEAPASGQSIRGIWGGMKGFDKALFVASAAAAATEASQMIKQGKPVGEAVYRGGVNLTVELLIGGIPITAAAQAASLVIFETASQITGNKVFSEVNVESAAKAMAQGAIDIVAGIAQEAGRNPASFDAKQLSNVNTQKLQDSLTDVETFLDDLTPGSFGSTRLMRIRARLRELLRAKHRANRLADIDKKISDIIALINRYDWRSEYVRDLRKQISRLKAIRKDLRKWDC